MITNIGKSCTSRKFLAPQECLLMLFAKIKFSQKFPDFQNKGSKWDKAYRKSSVLNTLEFSYNKIIVDVFIFVKMLLFVSLFFGDFLLLYLVFLKKCLDHTYPKFFGQLFTIVI